MTDKPVGHFADSQGDPYYEDDKPPEHAGGIPEPLPFTQSMDATLWAAEFKRLFPDSDEGLMIGWFANAIMRGFDEGERRAEARVKVLREKLDTLRKQFADEANDNQRLREALEWFKEMLDTQVLVRDISRDGEPDYYQRMTRFVAALKTHMDTLDVTGRPTDD